MTELSDRLRAWSDDAMTGRNIMGASSDLRDAAREIDDARNVIKMAIEYWNDKNRRYATRYPAWVRAAIDIGINPIDWK